ncbi:MAG: glycosyltransferase, partial [Methanobacteriota archaeon]
MKISIITVCRNAANSIAQTIRSVQSQDFQDVEHIIVDGASTDGTLDIINQYGSEAGCRIISEPDQGIYDAMNKGIGL